METTTRISKDAVLEALKDIPEDDPIPEALERLYVLLKLQKGIDEADAGNVISHEEAKKRFSKWLV